MCSDDRRIPKKLWLLWFQGTSKAPYIVKKCIDSWIKENPNWDISIIDNSNINNYVQHDISEEILNNIPLAHQSDLIRLLLLSKYGGVWADATTFCMRPLDDWIDSHVGSGFFMYYKPGSDRLISNWFIAAEKGSPICVKLFEKLRLYWIENKLSRPNLVQRKVRTLLSIILSSRIQTTKYWFNPVITRLLRVYPYRLFHYMFERLIAENDECNLIWNSTKRASADYPHLIQVNGLFSYPNHELKSYIANSQIPLFKLTWKYDEQKYTEHTLLYYLLEEIDQPRNTSLDNK